MRNDRGQFSGHLAAELGKKGQKKSAEVRRERRELKDVILQHLEIVDETSKKNNRELISEALIKQAKNGNIQAIQLLRDTIGEKPADIKINISEKFENLSTAEKIELAKKMRDELGI